MGKTTEQLQASKGGESAEQNGFGAAERPWRPAGVYKHKESGDEIIVKVHPKFGDAQAAAVERVGYVYERDAEEGEVKDLEVILTASAGGAKSTDDDSKDALKGIYARLDAAEAANKQLADENAALRAEQEKDGVKSADTAGTKAEATAQTENREEEVKTQEAKQNVAKQDAAKASTENTKKGDK